MRSVESGARDDTVSFCRNFVLLEQSWCCVYSFPFRMNYKVKYAPNWVFAFLCIAGRVCFCSNGHSMMICNIRSVPLEKYTIRQCEPPENEWSDVNGEAGHGGETIMKKKPSSLCCFPRTVYLPLLYRAIISPISPQLCCSLRTISGFIWSTNGRCGVAALPHWDETLRHEPEQIQVL